MARVSLLVTVPLQQALPIGSPTEQRLALMRPSSRWWHLQRIDRSAARLITCCDRLRSMIRRRPRAHGARRGAESLVPCSWLSDADGCVALRCVGNATESVVDSQLLRPAEGTAASRPHGVVVPSGRIDRCSAL